VESEWRVRMPQVVLPGSGRQEQEGAKRLCFRACAPFGANRRTSEPSIALSEPRRSIVAPDARERGERTLRPGSGRRFDVYSKGPDSPGEHSARVRGSAGEQGVESLEKHTPGTRRRIAGRDGGA
jgi:hypothetical protein